MRLFFEFTAIALLLFLGWEKPFNRWVSTPPPNPPPVSRAVLPANTARPAKASKSGPVSRPAVSGSWMWDKRHSTALDRGAYDSNDNVAQAPAVNTRAFPTDGTDKDGRRYWVDPYGVRHYY